MTNCIIWGNPDGALRVLDDATLRISYSCIQSAEAWPGEGNINVDPILVRDGVFDFSRGRAAAFSDGEPWLPDFIVEEPEYRLRPDSPCINAGTPEAAPEADLEGTPRPCVGGMWIDIDVDMGAYEYCGDEPPVPRRRFIRGDANTDHGLDIADAIFTFKYLFASGRAPTCLDAGDANDNGQVNIADGIYVLQYLFVGGPAVPSPYPGCGIDTTADVGGVDLGCKCYEGCP
jgi:hypothetical protein